jgi:hypothetical protein
MSGHIFPNGICDLANDGCREPPPVQKAPELVTELIPVSSGKTAGVLEGGAVGGIVVIHRLSLCFREVSGYSFRQKLAFYERAASGSVAIAAVPP